MRRIYIWSKAIYPNQKNVNSNLTLRNVCCEPLIHPFHFYHLPTPHKIKLDVNTSKIIVILPEDTETSPTAHRPIIRYYDYVYTCIHTLFNLMLFNLIHIAGFRPRSFFKEPDGIENMLFFSFCMRRNQNDVNKK